MNALPLRALMRFVLLLIPLVGSFAMATEQPNFTVVKKIDDIKVREYPQLLVAQTVVEGTRDAASNEGFRRLAGYIFGGNTATQSIAMTAPVTQTEGQKIAMTAPVAQMETTDHRWVIQFTMPSSFKTLESLPKPNDARVTLQVVPARAVAVLKYSGAWSEALYEKQLAVLRAGVASAGLVVLGEPTWARYDPPWKLWFLRTNEIHLQVEPPAPDKK